MRPRRVIEGSAKLTKQIQDRVQAVDTMYEIQDSFLHDVLPLAVVYSPSSEKPVASYRAEEGHCALVRTVKCPSTWQRTRRDICRFLWP